MPALSLFDGTEEGDEDPGLTLLTTIKLMVESQLRLQQRLEKGHKETHGRLDVVVERLDTLFSERKKTNHLLLKLTGEIVEMVAISLEELKTSTSSIAMTLSNVESSLENMDSVEEAKQHIHELKAMFTHHSDEVDLVLYDIRSQIDRFQQSMAVDMEQQSLIVEDRLKTFADEGMRHEEASRSLSHEDTVHPSPEPERPPPPEEREPERDDGVSDTNE